MLTLSVCVLLTLCGQSRQFFNSPIFGGTLTLCGQPRQFVDNPILGGTVTLCGQSRRFPDSLTCCVILTLCGQSHLLTLSEEGQNVPGSHEAFSTRIPAHRNQQVCVILPFLWECFHMNTTKADRAFHTRIYLHTDTNKADI